MTQLVRVSVVFPEESLAADAAGKLTVTCGKTILLISCLRYITHNSLILHPREYISNKKMWNFFQKLWVVYVNLKKMPMIL